MPRLKTHEDIREEAISRGCDPDEYERVCQAMTAREALPLDERIKLHAEKREATIQIMLDAYPSYAREYVEKLYDDMPV